MNTNRIEYRNVSEVEIPAWLLASVERRNRANAQDISRRKAARAAELRSAGRQPQPLPPQVRARSKNGVAYRWAQIEDGLISEDSQEDIARRRRLMQAIL